MWKKCCCLCARETYEPPDVQELDYKHSSLTEVPPEIFTYERTLEKLLLGSNQVKLLHAFLLIECQIRSQNRKNTFTNNYSRFWREPQSKTVSTIVVIGPLQCSQTK